MSFDAGLGRLLGAGDELHWLAGHMRGIDPAMRHELRLVADRLNELTGELRHG